MALTSAQIVQVCADLYAPSPSGFDDLLWPEANDGVCCALRRLGNDDLVVFRGSVTTEDWIRDFLAVPHEITTHPQLGDVHAGFMLGMEEAFAHLQPLLRQNVYITGHSLGAARATIFAGLMVASGKMPVGRVVFGEPRSGCAQLARLVRKVVINFSFRNTYAGHHDLITDVPTDPPFEHAIVLDDLDVIPAANDPWGIFRLHHIALYGQGLGVNGIPY